MQSAPASSAEVSAPQSPFVRATSSAERTTANLFAQPPGPVAQPAPVMDLPAVSPPLAVSTTEPSPGLPPVQPGPVEVSVGHSERAAYFGPSAPPEDANPIVRPEPGYVSPIPPRVMEQVPSSPSAPRVADTAPSTASAEPALASAFVPPMVEPAAVAEWPKKAFEQPSIATAPSEEAVRESESLPSSPLDVPVVHEPALETRVQANAFETAATEVAGSETPITAADASPASEPAHAEDATSTVAPTPEASLHEAAAAPGPNEEASQAPSPESVVQEGEIQEHAAVAVQPFPAPRSFTSSGSEMPVVITTPPPPRAQDTAAPSARLFDLGRELLPKAEAWSRKNLRATPRSLVIAAPLVALLGIWAIRGLVSHPKQASAEGTPNVAAEVAAATPAPEPANTSDAPAASAILVSASAAPPAAPAAADAAELASAVSHGLPALEALARKFPSDSQVSIALASEQAKAQRYQAAVESVERALAVDAKTAQNGKVMGILWRAAQSNATEPSFTALRKLGAKGADVAFDLATTAGVRDAVRERAKTELKSLSTDASADTRVATALFLASDCNARKALLSRAETEGGKRTQSLLEQYARGAACTSTTDAACNACLTGSSALTHALAQLNAGAQK